MAETCLRLLRAQRQHVSLFPGMFGPRAHVNKTMQNELRVLKRYLTVTL